MVQANQKSLSDRIDRGVALVRLANSVGSIMSQSRVVLDDSVRVPGGPLPQATQELLVELERVANAAAQALGSDPDARY